MQKELVVWLSLASGDRVRVAVSVHEDGGYLPDIVREPTLREWQELAAQMPLAGVRVERAE